MPKQIFATALFTVLACSQVHPADQTIKLRRDQIVKTQLPGKAILGQARCDSAQNIYMRLYDLQAPPTDALLRAPVKELTSEGQLVEQFAVTDAQKDFAGGDFFTSPKGLIYEIAWVPGTRDVYVVAFSRNGRVISTTRLDYQFEAHQLLVFRSGALLLSGLDFGDPHMNTPFTGLFSAAGHLIKKISFHQDSAIQKEAQTGNHAYVSSGPPFEGNLAIEYGDIAAGSDGNAYLMRRTSPVLIYVISPNGTLLDTFEVKEAGSLPLTLKSSHNRLAVLLHDDSGKMTRLRILSLKGTPIITYSVDDTLSDLIGCYDFPYFTFSGASDSGQINLYRAVPEPASRNQSTR